MLFQMRCLVQPKVMDLVKFHGPHYRREWAKESWGIALRDAASEWASSGGEKAGKSDCGEMLSQSLEHMWPGDLLMGPILPEGLQGQLETVRRWYNTCLGDSGAKLVQWEETKLSTAVICCYCHFAFSFTLENFVCSHGSYPLLITIALSFAHLLSLLPFILACSSSCCHLCFPLTLVCVCQLSLSIRLWLFLFTLHKDMYLGLAWKVIYWKNNSPKGFGSFFRNQYLGIT